MRPARVPVLTLDFKAATTTIPIVGVFALPVEYGIVASLARPGGNITGVTVDVGRNKREPIASYLSAELDRVEVDAAHCIQSARHSY
jgi:hypothetical protein